MTPLEIVLIIVIVILIGVLLLETYEYRVTRQLISNLEGTINAYTAGYTQIVTTVNALNSAYEQSTEDHREIALELIQQRALMEIHNRALQLSPKLVEPFTDENKIP